MFEARIPLRWSDLDAQSHVNNVVYLDFLQEARVQFLRRTPARSLLDEGVVVTGHQVEYLRPIAYHDQPLTVELTISEVGAARFEVAYDIHDAGELALRARTTCCPFDFGAQRPRRLRDAERAALSAELADTEPLRPLPRIRLAGEGYETAVKARWSDQDVYRHVNNVRTLDYFQEARARMLFAAEKLTGTDREPRIWYAVRQDVAYVGQTDYRDEPYVIRTAVSHLGNSSFTLHAEIYGDADALLATNDTVMVAGDPATGRPAPLTDGMRRAFGHYAIAG